MVLSQTEYTLIPYHAIPQNPRTAYIVTFFSLSLSLVRFTFKPGSYFLRKEGCDEKFLSNSLRIRSKYEPGLTVLLYFCPNAGQFCSELSSPLNFEIYSTAVE